MKTIMIAAAISLSMLGATSASAQVSTLAWVADTSEWRGIVAKDNTIEIRGVSGTIRAVRSADSEVHIVAKRDGRSLAPIQLIQHSDGITVCVEMCRRDKPRLAPGEGRIDFSITVPDGVRFSGDTVDGNVEVSGIAAAVNAASVNGSVRIESAGFPIRATTVKGDVDVNLASAHDADFYANTISGAIETDFPIHDAGPLLPDGTSPFAGRSGPRMMRGVIGRGGPEVRVVTVSGALRIRQQ